MSKKKITAEQPAFLGAHVLTTGYIVMRDQAPCCLINVTGSHKGGVLQPGLPIISFDRKRDAERAVERTVKARDAIRTSFVADWLREKVPCFLEGKAFEVLPIGRQS